MLFSASENTFINWTDHHSDINVYNLNGIYLYTTDDHSVFIHGSNMSRRQKRHEQELNALRRGSVMLGVRPCIKRMSNHFPSDTTFIFGPHFELDYSLFCHTFHLKMWFIPRGWLIRRVFDCNRNENTDGLSLCRVLMVTEFLKNAPGTTSRSEGVVTESKWTAVVGTVCLHHLLKSVTLTIVSCYTYMFSNVHMRCRSFLKQWPSFSCYLLNLYHMSS